MDDIDVQELKRTLSYNPDDGLFTRMAPTGGVREGATAGWVNTEGYTCITFKKKHHRAHRLAFIFMGEPVPAIVDHINGNRTDNRWTNLRPTDLVGNQRNAKRRSDNTSGVPGVYFVRTSGSWRAAIKIGGREEHLGVYASWFDAVCARKSAERRHGFHPNHGRR